jgi:hypothetical protein
VPVCVCVCVRVCVCAHSWRAHTRAGARARTQGATRHARARSLAARAPARAPQASDRTRAHTRTCNRHELLAQLHAPVALRVLLLHDAVERRVVCAQVRAHDVLQLVLGAPACVCVCLCVCVRVACAAACRWEVRHGVSVGGGVPRCPGACAARAAALSKLGAPAWQGLLCARRVRGCGARGASSARTTLSAQGTRTSTARPTPQLTSPPAACWTAAWPRPPPGTGSWG